MRLSLPCALALLVLSAGCTSTYTVRKLEPRNGTDVPPHAVHYALPLSVLTVEVPITRTVTTAGPCADRRDLLEQLGISRVTRVPSVSFRHGDFVLGSRTAPDPAQVYAVHLIGPALQKRQQELKLSELGLLQSATTETRNEAINFAVKTFSSLAGIAGRLVTAGVLDASPGDEPEQREDFCTTVANTIKDLRRNRLSFYTGLTSYPEGGPEALKTLIQGSEALEAQLLDQFTGLREITKGNIRCEFRPGSRQADGSIADPQPAQALYLLAPQLGILGFHDQQCTVPLAFRAPAEIGSAGIARALAPLLYQDLEGRLLPPDPASALGAHLAERDLEWPAFLAGMAEAIAQEVGDNQKASFPPATGVTVSISVPEPRRLVEGALKKVIPKEADPDPPAALQALMQLEPTITKLLRQVLAGADLAASLQRALPRPIELRVTPLAYDFDATVGNGQRQPRSKEGFFYRVPGSAIVRVLEGGDVRAEQRRQTVPQFGVIAALPGGRDLNGSLSAKYQALFYANSGALQQLNTDQTPVEATAVTDVGTAIGGLIDAREARKKAEDAAADELTQLERRKKILQAEKDIRDLETALGIQETDGNN